MTLAQNFPFAAIMLCLAGGALCCALKPRAAMAVGTGLNALIAVMMVAVLDYTLQAGESYRYMMGHFPAPWGNEIRIGPLEALMGMAFPLVMTVILCGGIGHIREDVEPGKIQFYFAAACLLMASLLALTFTNDLFTAYVFVEINTLTSCALVMVRYRNGTALTATIRYLIMSLLGSGLFLIGVVTLYHITGHLLMEPIGEQIRKLHDTGEYAFPLTVTVGLFAAGLSLKSALWPFSSWLPDAHASATTASSGILSGLVIKGYVILLIKIFYRVIGLDIILDTGVTNVLFVFGTGGMLMGSLYALRARDIKRMLAYSSVAQVGYIFAAIGLGTEAGLTAACIQILVHMTTKPMLFHAAGELISASGDSRAFAGLRGAGRRNPLAGLLFVTGALSMIGVPLLAGFATKYWLGTAAIDALGWKGIAVLAALVISTVLNAMYYIPALQILFDRAGKKTGNEAAGKPSLLTTAAACAFLALQFAMGFSFSRIAEMIQTGLKLLS